MTQQGKRHLLTPVGQLCYIKGIFEMTAPPNSPTAKPAYNAGMMVDKDYAKEMGFDATGKEIKRRGDERFNGANWRFESVKDGDKLAARDAKKAHFAGHWVIVCRNTKRQPTIFLPDGSTIDEDPQREHIYVGRLAQFLFVPYFYEEGGFGGSLWLNAINLMDGGVRISPKPPTDEEMRDEFRAAVPAKLPPVQQVEDALPESVAGAAGAVKPLTEKEEEEIPW